MARAVLAAGAYPERVREPGETVNTGVRGQRVLVALLALALLAAACSSSGKGGSAAGDHAKGHPKVDRGGKTTTASFKVVGGVESATVTGAAAKAKLTLVDVGGHKLLTEVADARGQAVFAYIPHDYTTIVTGTGDAPPTTSGTTLQKGRGYTIRDESADPVAVTKPFDVLGRDDHPPTSLYDGQQLKSVAYAIVGGKPKDPAAKPADGFSYITVRDGVRLSTVVHLPDPGIYGPGPYPTVVEYSGYGVSNPDSPQPGSMIANALGYATVGVNMRGTACSGGVFDVFNPAQQADGYDMIETIARQPWVKGHKVGMVGLSYSGIAQLYVAATRPPSLSAITPLSVIEDPWKMSWPGGIYNAGFTKQWLQERDKEASAGGQNWVGQRIKAGDKICQANQQLRSQNIDFQKFSESLEFRPDAMNARDLSRLVKDIDVPVYLTGAWQDEQTGPRFATMLGNFTKSADAHFVLFNGHHPDGYLPINLSRWAEFLSIYVDHTVPKLPDVVRAGAPALFKDAFGAQLEFTPDRFADLAPDQYDAALARWKADPKVTVRYEMGDGDPAVPGKQLPRYEATFDSWPPKGISASTWYMGDKGVLADAKPTGAGGADSYRFDPDIGMVGYASKANYNFQTPMVKLPWQDTAPGKGLSYLTEPLAQDTTIAGPGYADLWFKSDATDAGIEVVLSEVTPDGTEFRLQNGLLRAGDRKVDAATSNQFQINETFTKADYQPLPAGRFTEVKVPIFPVSAVLRKGSRLRVQINTPGGDLPYWFFDNPDYGKPNARQYVSRTPTMASSLVLPTLPVGTVTPTPGYAPCPSLRGEVCRPYKVLENQPG